MAINAIKLQSEEDAAHLLELFAKLPKVTTTAEPEPKKPRNDNWKAKSINPIRSRGRVNRTKGK